MSKNIIFDIGFVLIDWEPDRVYRNYFADHEKMQRFYAETRIFELNLELDKGLPFKKALQNLAAQFPHYHEPIHLWETKWPEMIVGIVDASVAILKKLHQLGYPLYAITNWSAETFPYVLNKYDFFTCFRDIVVSGKEKVIKPHPEIYQILLKRNNLNAQDCLFIDDNADNVVGAQKLGISAIKYEDSEQLMLALLEENIFI